MACVYFKSHKQLVYYNNWNAISKSGASDKKWQI